MNLVDILAQIDELNTNNDYQWGYLQETFQGSIQTNFESGFWDDFKNVCQSFQEAAGELDTALQTINNRLPCD